MWSMPTSRSSSALRFRPLMVLWFGETVEVRHSKADHHHCCLAAEIYLDGKAKNMDHENNVGLLLGLV